MSARAQTQIELLDAIVRIGVPLMLVELLMMSLAERERRRRMCARLMATWVGERVINPGSFPPEDVSRALDIYCESLAHLAFRPGGVTAHGQHWEAAQ